MGIVTGVVTRNGEALDGISVLFQADSTKGYTGMASGAVTDADGNYRLKYSIPVKGDPANPRTGDGALIGPHKIMLSDFKKANEMLKAPSRVPVPYARPDTTPLRFEVEAGEQQFNIELK